MDVVNFPLAVKSLFWGVTPIISTLSFFQSESYGHLQLHGAEKHALPCACHERTMEIFLIKSTKI